MKIILENTYKKQMRAGDASKFIANESERHSPLK